MEKKGSVGDFFVTADAAKAAIGKLTSQRIHPQFSGYLATVATAVEENSGSNLKVNFQRFHNDYLLVAGASRERPYLQPFSESEKGKPQLFNRNVAGSYAPSSLRGVAPIREVVEFAGTGRNVKQTLEANHEELAFRSLAGSQKIPVHSLATFLFRDHRIPLIEAGKYLESTLSMFFEIFGYDLLNSDSKDRFSRLYAFDEITFDGLTYGKDN